MMKNLKKILASLTAVFMMLVCFGSSSVFADGTEPVATAKYTYTDTDATEDGKITITNATVGESYTLYKIFDATYDSEDSSKISYTVKDGALKNALSSEYFTVGATADAAGNYSVVRVSSKTDAQLIEYIQTLKSYFTKIGEIKLAGASSISFENIPYGYYYLESSLGTVVTIDSNNPSVDIIDKNQKASVDKNIITTDTVNGELVEYKSKFGDISLDENVDFRIEVAATNYDGDEKVYKYEITDTLDNGMSYSTLPPTVKVIDGETTHTITDATIEYFDKENKKVTYSDVTRTTIQKFVITINWTTDGTFDANHLYGSNATIQIDYKAYLDSNKSDNLVVGNTGNDGNTNTVTVKNYKDTKTPITEVPNGTIGTAKTENFTTKLAIHKVDDDNNALQGAEFTLTSTDGMNVVLVTEETFVLDNADGTYWLLKDGTYTLQDPDGTIDGNPIDTSVYDNVHEKYKKTTVLAAKGVGKTDTTIKGEVDSDGNVTFTGLSAGSYTLVESVVPAGYNKIADISFKITFSCDKETDVAGNITWSNPKFETDSNVINVGENNTLTTTIQNNKGSELPSTGGMGTTILYIAGGILVLGAAIFFVTNKRMQKN